MNAIQEQRIRMLVNWLRDLQLDEETAVRLIAATFASETPHLPAPEPVKPPTTCADCGGTGTFQFDFVDSRPSIVGPCHCVRPPADARTPAAGTAPKGVK